MKKIMLGLTVILGIGLAGCSEEVNSVDNKEIKVSSDGVFEITGTAKKSSLFFVNDQLITSANQDKDGNYKVNVQLNEVVPEVNFKIKYSNDELLNEILKLDVSDLEEQITKESIDEELRLEKEALEKELAEKEKIEKEVAREKERLENSDITKLSNDPTTEQVATLNNLMNQKFKQDYPYKGSKIHSVLGVIQPWTSVDDYWFYKTEATIVNAFNAEQKVIIEVTITPTDASSGLVEIIDY